MSAPERNKSVVLRVVEEVINGKDLDAVDELFAPDFVLRHGGPPGLPAGTEGARQWFGLFHTAFPDVHLVVDDALAEDDKVTIRFTARGTHQGELFGISPTNAAVEWTGLVLSRLEGGKVVEDWVSQDQLGLLQQLGGIPAPGRI